MDANSQVTVDASQFNRKIQEWMVASGKSAADTLRTQGRLLIKQCLNFTPPKLLAQGRAAIKTDLFSDKKGKGVFFLAEPYMLKNKMSEKGNVRLFISGDAIYGTDSAHYKPDAGLEILRAEHRKWTSRATGRVNITGNQMTNSGKWRQINRMVVRKATGNKYFAYVASHVGRLKAGWLPAYLSLGAGSPASWISRHASGARGIVVNLLADKDNPNIIIGNYAAGARQLKHIVTEALRARSEAIGRDIKLYTRGIKDRTRT